MMDKDEGPRLFDTGRGLSCSWGKRQLYHPQRPVEQVLARVEAFTPREGEILLIPSPLLWHGIRELKQKIPNSSMILAVEAEPELYRLAADHVPGGLMEEKRLQLVPEEGVDAFLRAFDFSAYRRCRMLPLNGAYQFHRSFYQRVLEGILGGIKRFWQNRITFTWFGPLWLKNLFSNCGVLAGKNDSYPGPEACASRKPLLIIGAGPSLDDVLPIVKEYRSCFTILAVDTALSSLAARQVVPDYALAQDGQFHTLGDFTTAPHMLGVPLLFDLTSARALPRHLSGTIIPFFTRFDSSGLASRIEAVVKGLVCLPPLGSVGITALAVGELMDPPEILVIGLDFAYLMGKSHALDSPFHRREILMRDRLHPEGDFATLLARNPRPLWSSQEALPRVYTDPVLAGYQDTFSHRLGGQELEKGRKGRILYSLRTPSISLNQVRRSLEEVVQSLAESNGGKVARSPDSVLRSKTVNSEDFIRFLQGERILLERYLGGEHSLLKEIDHVYRFFPDLHRFDPARPDQAVLGRIDASARQILRHIEQALTLRRS